MSAPDYKGFALAIMEGWEEHCDIEASEKFDLAVRYGMLREVPGGFDPESHDDMGGCAERGDPWYELNDATDQRIAEAVAAAYEDAAGIARRYVHRNDDSAERAIRARKGVE